MRHNTAALVSANKTVPTMLFCTERPSPDRMRNHDEVCGEEARDHLCRFYGPYEKEVAAKTPLLWLAR